MQVFLCEYVEGVVHALDEVSAGLLIAAGSSDLLAPHRVDCIVVGARDGKHGAAVAFFKLSQHVRVGNVIAPLQAHVQAVAPVKLHHKESVLFRFGIVLFGEEAVEHHVRCAGPGHDGLEGFRLPCAGKQRIRAALAPAHYADGIAVDLVKTGHVLSGCFGIRNCGLEGVLHIIGCAVSVAREVDADCGEAVLRSQNRCGIQVAVAGFVTGRAGAVQHHNRGEGAFACGNAYGGRDVVLRTGDGHDGLFIACILGKCRGAQRQNKGKYQYQ